MLVPRHILLSCLSAAALLTACSQTDSRLIPLKLDLPANPAQGKSVRIESVTDSRSFELHPRRADLPSLLPEDFDKPGLRQRAIGRQRDPYGKAIGELLLPEGQTTATLFHDVTIQAFRQAGYRVLSRGEPGFELATPLTVTILGYWNWVVMGVIPKASCRAEANVQAPFSPFKDGLVVAGLAQQGNHPRQPDELTDGAREAITDADWRDVASRCLNAYSDNLKAMLAR